jgi:hypothetical protein
VSPSRHRPVPPVWVSMLLTAAVLAGGALALDAALGLNRWIGVLVIALALYLAARAVQRRAGHD